MIKFYQLARKHTDKALLTLTASTASALAFATPSHAAGDIDDLFVALNVAGLNANIKTILLAGVAVTLLFVGYRMLKRGAASF